MESVQTAVVPGIWDGQVEEGVRVSKELGTGQLPPQWQPPLEIPLISYSISIVTAVSAAIAVVLHLA
jgi:hypothetical protein